MRFFRKRRADPFAAFAETYGVRTPRDAPPPKAESDEPKPIEPTPTWAHRVLGVPLGASQEQIGAAYRRLAREHHPDKAAGLSPEAREHAEERMKEINVAYSELKR